MTVSTTRWRETVVAATCFAAVAAMAHFFYFRHMGLYEDDYIYTLGCFDWGWARWWDELTRAFTEPVQGRPLNHAFRRSLNFLTLHGDTLVLSQAASWAMLVINATLLFRLVRRYAGATAALAAGLLYLLYPADTSRQILMHQSDLLLGAMLCLLGLHAFAAGRPWLGWLFGLACLLNYESFFLPLVVGPLLAQETDAEKENPGLKQQLTEKPWLRWAAHLTWFGLLAAAVLGARALLGEQRAASLGEGAGSTLMKSAQAVVLGPWISLKALFLRPAEFIGTTSLLHRMLALLALLVMSSLLFISERNASRSGLRRPPTGRLALAGLLAWAAGYALCIRPDNSPPTILIGRLTGMHVAGSIGCALLAGAVLEAALARLSDIRARLTLIGGVAVLLALMVGFGLNVQRNEYARHWKEQGRFWRELMPLVSDLREGEPVIVDCDGPAGAFPETDGFPRFGMVNYCPAVLHRVADYPEGWKSKPRVYGLWKGCPHEDKGETRVLKTPSWFWDGLWPIVKDEGFVFIRAKGEHLERVGGPVDILGRQFQARKPDRELKAQVSANARFRALFGEPGAR
jgi:hypothetical protein